MCEGWTVVDKFTSELKRGDHFGQFIQNLEFEALPNDVVHQAKRLVLEGISWFYIGKRRPQSENLETFIKSVTAKQEASIVCYPEKVDMIWAVFANSYYAQAEGGNDGQREASVYGGSYHPGRCIIPVALAVAEKYGVSGKVLITAIVAGYEAAYRFRGLSPRPPSEAYAAAVTAAKIMDLNAEQIIDAMSISGYNTSRVTDSAAYNPVNFLTTGNISKIGVEASLMAEAGIPAPPLQDDSRFSPRFKSDGLGKTFGISQLYIKPYLGCRLLQGAIDAALDFRANVTSDYKSIDEIRVRTITEAAYTAHHVTSESYYIDCQLSLPYCVACALIDGDVGENQFTPERIANQDIQDLHNKVRVVLDEDLDAEYPEKGRPTIMEVRAKDGQIHRHERRYDKGEPENPLTDEELIEKFRKWVGPSLSEEVKQKMIDTVFNMDGRKDLALLTDLLRSGDQP